MAACVPCAVYSALNGFEVPQTTHVRLWDAALVFYCNGTELLLLQGAETTLSIIGKNGKNVNVLYPW